MRNFKNLNAILSMANFVYGLQIACAKTSAKGEDCHYVIDGDNIEDYDPNHFKPCPKKGLKVSVTCVNQQGATGILKHYKLTVTCPMFSVANERLTFVDLGVTRNGVTITPDILDVISSTKLDRRGAHLDRSIREGLDEVKHLTNMMDDYFYDIHKTVAGVSHYILKPIVNKEGFTGLVATAFVGKPLTIKKL